MKLGHIIFILTVFLLLSGCMVFSFYPLYRQEDLFANDLLVGEWLEEDSASWQFDFYYRGEEHLPENRDSTSFLLHIKDPDCKEARQASFRVHIIRLAGHYFLDFFLEEYFCDDVDLFDLHLMPVHSFARLDLQDSSAVIRWFDPDWLEDLFKKKREQISFQDNGDSFLLTAKTEELQKFVAKHANNPKAFSGGVVMELRRINR